MVGTLSLTAEEEVEDMGSTLSPLNECKEAEDMFGTNEEEVEDMSSTLFSLIGCKEAGKMGGKQVEDVGTASLSVGLGPAVESTCLISCRVDCGISLSSTA